MFGIKMVLSELSRLYEILKSNENMTPEEYIQSKVINDNGYEHHSCEMVSKYDALRAIDMARNENKNKNNNAVGMQGWICPKCGRVYSPFTSMCCHCGNADD